MQPSSLRVGAISARSSASSKNSWPSRGRRMTARVTASFGSLPLPADLAPRLEGLRDAARFFFFLAMMAGIVLQLGRMARVDGGGNERRIRRPDRGGRPIRKGRGPRL